MKKTMFFAISLFCITILLSHLLASAMAASRAKHVSGLNYRPSSSQTNQESSDSRRASGGHSAISGTVTNSARIKKSANIVFGKDNKARMGSIAIKNATVKGDVTNNARIDKAANVVFGKDNVANMGTTTIKDANIKGKVTNNAKVDKSANVVFGKDNQVSAASTDIE